MMRERDVTIFYLELPEPGAFRPAPNKGPELMLMQARHATPELHRFLYTAVGGDWFWVDRLPWTRRQWLDDIERPGVELWVAYLEGTPAGYYHLVREADGMVDIHYFGLMPFMTGRGCGGWLLSQAIERALALGSGRVTVNTCTLDHEAALANYLARGFVEVRRECFSKALPRHAPGPWPGA
ncbi:MAG: GNAT family N-acetyltransferase [Gammaproteobacteria bacterium]|nr:GNAT family N-acetyltransferase [Gammaproteobacteria bacterium]